ncbi:hypothetical protein JCM11641_000674 [Rhodosporidiobolus odoratus]
MSATSVAKVTATLVGPALSTVTATLPAKAPPSAHAASIFDPSHPNPVAFDSSNPLVLFIVQAFIIVALSRLLHLGLRYLRQPRVISEVIAGIVVGPSILGRIPGFTSSIFPAPSVPFVSLVANLGLVLFLFIVGLEVDFGLLRRNFKVSASISLIGMVVPFALGAAVSKGIYDRFVDETTVDFGTFLLFIGTANAITAFPVLARILTDENLLKNHVGVVVLSAGVGNDVVGWILLALAIALVNASSGIIVLYVLLTSFGWILVLWFIGRPLLKLVGRKTGSFGHEGPSQTMTAFVLFLVLTSAWITDRIGIHAIFGAFLVGLIVPKEIRTHLTEKIEDLVTVLLLPLYFALSGLKTDLGLLRDGSIWGWVVCVIVVAFFSKFLSCGGVARAFGMDWRESGAAGSLMACKGLVELIVLNIGLSAGILNSQVFAMFVVMALVTTFLTTPLTLAFYPAWYRVKTERERRGLASSPHHDTASPFGDDKPRTRVAVVLEQFDQLPGVMSFLRLLSAAPVAKEAELPQLEAKKTEKSAQIEKRKSTLKAEESDEDASPTKDRSAVDLPAVSAKPAAGTLSLSALRLVPLTDRTSTLLRTSEPEASLLRQDALSTVLRAFTSGLALPTSLSLNIVAPESYPRAVAEFVEEKEAELVIVPWALPAGGKLAEEGVAEGILPNPLEGLFGGKEGTSVGVQGAVGYASVVRRVFAESPCDVALLLDRSSAAPSPSTLAPFLAHRAHLHLTFHGGSDDRLALSLLIQLVSSNPGLTATVLRLTRAPEPTDDDRKTFATAEGTLEPSLTALSSPPVTREDAPLFTVAGTHASGGGGFADTVYATNAGTQAGGDGAAGHGLQSESADEALLARFFDLSSPSPSSPSPLAEATRARISYTTASTASPLRFSASHVSNLRTHLLISSRIPLLHLIGRGRRDAQSHTAELSQLLKEHEGRVRKSVLVGSEVRRAVGDAAVAVLLLAGGEGEEEGERLLVVQKRGKGGRVGGA